MKGVRRLVGLLSSLVIGQIVGAAAERTSGLKLKSPTPFSYYGIGNGKSRKSKQNRLHTSRNSRNRHKRRSKS